MIKTIRHKDLLRLYKTGSTKGVPVDLARKLELMLDYLNSATDSKGMDTPNWRLHALVGNLKGFWSVKVSANWRLVFRFEGSDATDVDLIDYH